MTSNPTLTPDHGSSRQFIILKAARIWRRAQRLGDSVQPRLYAALKRHRCEALAPAFDSLMALAEQVLGRKLRTGRSSRLSADENFLLDMMETGRSTRQDYRCTQELASAFCCAVVSTRIMMSMELAPRAV